MGKDIIIGLDAGTSVIKAVAFNSEGKLVAKHSTPNLYTHGENGHAEQDMDRTWAAAADVLAGLARKIPDLDKRLVAISITGQGDGTWLLDTHNRPLGPALLWLDSRASGIVSSKIAKPDYPEHYQRTGTGLNACQQSSQLLWIREHQPERFAKAATAFHAKDWLYFCLTGERATDPSEAVFTFGNFRTRQYDDEVIGRLGLNGSAELLPEIVDGTLASHPLAPDAARQCGLTAGVPVILGYVDVICAALGGGLYDGVSTESGCSIVGTTGMHIKLVESPDKATLDPACTGYTMCFPAPGMLAQMQSNMAATLNIDWMLDVALEVCADLGVAADRRALIAIADKKIPLLPDASALFHPYISNAGERGPFLDPDARASFVGLENAHGFYHMLKAVFEGLAFAGWDCYSAMGDIPNDIRLAGGASNSTIFRAIMASVLGRPIRHVEQEESGAAGAAMMAAVQTGIYPDMASAARNWVYPLLGEPVLPNAIAESQYHPLRNIYRQTRRQLQPVWHAFHQHKGHAQ